MTLHGPGSPGAGAQGLLVTNGTKAQTTGQHRQGEQSGSARSVRCPRSHGWPRRRQSHTGALAPHCPPPTSTPPWGVKRLTRKHNGDVLSARPLVAPGKRMPESTWGQGSFFPLHLEASGTADPQRVPAKRSKGLRSARHQVLRQMPTWGPRRMEHAGCREGIRRAPRGLLGTPAASLRSHVQARRPCPLGSHGLSAHPPWDHISRVAGDLQTSVSH